MKKVCSIIVVIILSIQFGFSQNQIFKAPDKVVKKSNFHTSYPIYNDTSEARVYFYFVDAIVDTVVVRTDTVEVVIDESCEIEIFTASLKGLRICGSGIYLLNNNGELIYNKAFEEVYFGRSVFEIIMLEEPMCGYYVFGGYEIIDEASTRVSYTSHDNYSLPIIDQGAYIHIDKNHPFLVKYKGKWGLLNLNGTFMVEPEYDQIVWGKRGIELYKDRVLDSIIAY